MSNLLKGNRAGLIKTAAILTAVSTVLSLSAVLSFSAFAAAPGDYGLKEGWTISAAGTNDPDVYIVNDWGYKRLFLNPAIFGFYGHLGGFAAVHNVSATTRDAFPTSGLFRNCETNDQKVYGVETTGEDTGMLHWVNTTGAQAVADDANFFKKVFCINNNEFNWYSKGSAYTSVNQVPSYARVPGATPAPMAGSINVSLDASNPGAASLTTKANGVTFLKLNLSGSGTLASVKVTRKGPGATGDFSNVYLYDGATRLTSGRTPNSSDGSVTFSNLNLAVSGSKVLSVVADLSSSGATVGNVNYFAVLQSSDITLSAGGTIGGSFPLNGSNFTVTGQTGGVLTVDKSSSLSNPNAGQSNVEVSEFKLTAATEGAKISRLQMIQGGSMKIGDFTNLTAQVNGVTVATGYTTSNGYIVFDFGSSPYVIAKGDNRVFKIYANIAGKKSETIILYFENSADVFAVGDQFGFGMSITFNTMNTSGSTVSHNLTLQGGILTLSFIGPSATKVSTTTTKTHLLDFDMNSAANIEVRKTAIVLCLDQTGNGYSSADDPSTASLAAGFNDLNNVTLIDRDTGTALVGPSDGTAFTTKSSALTGGAATDCGTGTAGYSKLFTDAYNMNAGETKHLAIVADIRQSNTGVGGSLLTVGSVNSQFTGMIFGYGNLVGSSGDVTIMKYTGTNTAVANTDIVPSGNINGNIMTVQGSSLTLALSSNPASGNHNFVKGTSNITANGFAFQAAQGSALTINKVTLTGYAGSAATTLSQGTNQTVGALVNAVRLVDGDTGAVIATAPTTNNLSLTTGTGAGQAAFSNINWVIPAGATKNLLVKVDLSTNTPGTNNIFAFDVNATDDIVAVDANSNTVNAAAARVNGATSATAQNATTYVTVASAGSLVSANAADAPVAQPVYWGQTLAPMSKFKFTSTNEGFWITKLTLLSGNVLTTASRSAGVNNIDSAQISYTNQAGQTVTANGTFNNSGSASFSFAGDSRPYVPKDGTAYISAYANLKTAASLFRAGGSHVAFYLSGGFDRKNDFQAIGEGSGTTVDGNSTGLNQTASGSAMVIYRAYPTFTYLSTPATTIAVGQDLLKFRVDANGVNSDGATVFFDGATAAVSGSVDFGVVASGEAGTTTLGLDLRRVIDSTGSSVDQLVTALNVSPSDANENAGIATSASFRFQDVSTNQAINIPAGTSNTFVLRLNNVAGINKPINTTNGRSADYVQVRMRNEYRKILWTDNSGTDRNHNVYGEANMLKNLPMLGARVNVQ